MIAGDIEGRPGLYAIHAEPETWVSLGLGSPPDGRPLYVGKSESSLLSRDLRTHFASGRTGSSTLRRSFAALLREELHLMATPRNPEKPERFANYGLLPGGDDRLTEWMLDSLSIGTWPKSGPAPLERTEREVLGVLVPPLNLKDVDTHWKAQVKAARKVMADEARAHATR